jgi:hypothetical protein
VPRDAGHRHVHPQAAAPQPGLALKTDEPDPLIHVPARLKIVAPLAALPDRGALPFTRLPDMIGLTPGNLPIHLRKLEDVDTSFESQAQQGRQAVREPAHRDLSTLRPDSTAIPARTAPPASSFN